MVIEFIYNLVDLFYTERDKLRIGMAHYATDVTNDFYLNTYSNRDDVISAIDDSKTAALGLKASGVRIYAVGVGDIEDELENLASESSTAARASTFEELSELNEQILETLDDEVKGVKLCTGVLEAPKACNVEVLVGFDVGAQNIFSAQTNLQSKMGAILQRITKMAPISCSSGQVPSVQVGILAMDSNGQASHLDFTDDADVLFEAFKGLRSRGPFVLNAKTISAYTDRFKTRNDNVVKRAPKFEEALLLEFGRGFRYTRPLRVNVMDLDYELMEELGERGPPGVNGTQGFQGCPGQRGVKGVSGVAGPPGDRGNSGNRGPKGTKGQAGDSGDMGIRGDPGISGRDNREGGPKGDPGDVGPVVMESPEKTARREAQESLAEGAHLVQLGHPDLGERRVILDPEDLEEVREHSVQRAGEERWVARAMKAFQVSQDPREQLETPALKVDRDPKETVVRGARKDREDLGWCNVTSSRRSEITV
ncbi:hypothetical protein CRUP_010177, partial [Coryphaenoides rupestris]